ncbi:hypothetical protein SERLADRAFT_356596 [Serpula lacrymans var. lacrymans S7.9]|uniref:ABM domain-containing protein n=1 Tax=Serpula lacrymans var. lacrymans (strain S7.9) TaxID=578457 RepID=F8NYZ8_SERL9|nr:uncharacterized protein SERLADRAFT_356596 [Serpula lacrymans var. lacrymans S7.9]EGO23818.1 hypothetical protein SERLADRAFT_356596 [Serpula lacrymans var. lacrymans S7.9]
MSFPVPEIAVFKASDAYKADPSSLHGLFDTLATTEGMSGTYYGFETEDPSNLFTVHVWDTKEASLAFRNRKDFDDVVAASLPAFGSQPDVSHVQFTSDVIRPLAAPATEFVTFTLKEGQSVENLLPLVKQLYEGVAITPTAHGSSWGPVIGKPDVYYGILGWDTVQAHWDAVSAGPLKVIIDNVKEIAAISLVHALLKKYTK